MSFFFFENTSKKFKLNLVLVLTFKALHSTTIAFNILQTYD